MERKEYFNLVLIELHHDGGIDIPPGLSSLVQTSNIWSYLTENIISRIQDTASPILFWDEGFLEGLYLMDSDLEECDKNIRSIIEDFIAYRNSSTLIICTTHTFITRIHQVLVDGEGFLGANLGYCILRGKTQNTELHLVLPPQRTHGRPVFIRSTLPPRFVKE